MSTVVVTGADGFVGRPLCALLAAHGDSVRATVRRHGEQVLPKGVKAHATGDLHGSPDWLTVVEGSDCVIHLAGRAHVVHETSSDSATAFHRVNVEATAALFRACAQAGVRRFVFVSSIGVLGIASGDLPFSATSKPHPTEAYAISKWHAERELEALAATCKTELVIVRPTLVCGVGAKGNFQRLVRLVERRLPLPLASLRGRRNFVGLTNLCDLLELCSKHPAAAGQTFLAADEATYTTPQLIRIIADAISLRARLLPCPPALLHLAGAILGRRAEVRRLTASLLVDSSNARIELGWEDRHPVDEEIIAMARAARVNELSTAP